MTTNIPIRLQPHIRLLEALFARVGDGQFRKSDYSEAQIIIGGLTPREQRHISDYFDSVDPWRCGYFLMLVTEMQPPAADYSKPRPANRPVRLLLEDFRNKRSKRVGEARKELLRRYEELDADDQLAFRIALMQGGSRTDRVAGCKYALERWDGQELEHAEAVWREALDAQLYDPWYWSGRVLLRHAPEEFLLANRHALTHLRTGEAEVKALYYYLALRLCGHPDFTLDKSRLRIGEYYRILHHNGARVSDSEWADDFYTAVAEIYTFSLHDDGIHPYSSGIAGPRARKLTKADEQLPGAAWLQKCERSEFRLAQMSSLRSLLLYGGLMGCESVLPALEYLHRAEDAMIREAASAPDTCLQGRFEWTWDKWVFMKSKVENPIREPLLQCCPERYRSCFERQIAEYEAWLRPYAETAKRLGYYDEAPPLCDRNGKTPDALDYVRELEEALVRSGVPGMQYGRDSILLRPEVQQLRDLIGLEQDDVPF